MNTDDPYPMFLDRVILHLFSHVLGIRGQEKFQTDMHQNLFCFLSRYSVRFGVRVTDEVLNLTWLHFFKLFLTSMGWRAMRTAKLLRWLHVHMVREALESCLEQPSVDQAPVSVQYAQM